MALALEAQARGADPRIRQVDAADYGDGSVEVALVSTTGIRASTRKTSAHISVRVIAGDGDASQTAGGFSVRPPRARSSHRALSLYNFIIFSAMSFGFWLIHKRPVFSSSTISTTPHFR